MSSLTLKDTLTKLAGLLAGGLLGLYVLGFLTTRGTGRSVAIAIVCTVVFSGYIAAFELGWITQEWFMETWGLSENLATWFARPVHTYYSGVVGHIILFVVAYGLSCLFEKKRCDLPNYTVWTQDGTDIEE
jgi:SSS family solute:Na+ symporter